MLTLDGIANSATGWRTGCQSWLTATHAAMNISILQKKIIESSYLLIFELVSLWRARLWEDNYK